MSKSNNPYKDLVINRSSMQAVCESLGYEQYTYVPVGNSFHLGLVCEGKPFKMAVYQNNLGTTTLSYLSGQDLAVYKVVAEAIATQCKGGDGGRFELSVPRFPPGHVVTLLEYLAESGVKTESDLTEPSYRMIKLRGVEGDVLTVKFHKTGTLQLQGKRAMVATLVLDYLSNVLDYSGAVKAQLDTFSVNIEVKQVADEFEGRFPLAHRRITDVVRAQLVTALALSKVNIELPDYSPIAFPALRGLEGFIKVELQTAGLNPVKMNDFGEYFEKNVHEFKMREVPHEHVGQLTSTSLANCYTVFNTERHGIAHMGLTQAETRILPTLSNAQHIVTKVITTIEEFCRILAK